VVLEVVCALVTQDWHSHANSSANGDEKQDRLQMQAIRCATVICSNLMW
jgi:hypothetical protein